MIGARTVLCRRRLLGLGILSAALCGLGAVGAGPASAATFHVTETENNSSGPNGIVQAVAKANADAEANTIVLAAGTYLPLSTLKLTNTSGPQTIEGPTNLPAATLSGGAVVPFPSELLVINSGVSLTIKEVQLGTLAGGLGVPGIVDSGSLTLESSTVAGSKGAQIVVEQVGTLTARNSTISDGSDFGVIDRGAASLFNSTVGFNKSGGIEDTGQLNLTNTIVADNTSSAGTDCTGAATTSDHSLDSDGTCGVEKSKVNPLLQTQLRNDGGSMQVHTEKPGSPAIDAADPAACPATDEVGHPRPDVAATACDLGADEFNEVKPTIKVPANITATATTIEGVEAAEVTYTVEATAPLSVVRSIECLNQKNEPEPSGSRFPVGTTTLTCTAIDGHENTATGSFTITVNPQVTATAPSVETKPASAVAQTTATLNATVNPNGSAISECKFEYGTSTAYGKTAPCSSTPGSGTTAEAVSAAVTGLTPNTTYDFRVVAKNAGGTGEGANETFKTLAEIVALPPSVETKPASAVSQTSATLNATVNPNGSAISECTFEYGTTTAYGKTAPCTPTPGSGMSPETVSAAVSGLAANTTYDFRVVAKNAGGTGEGGNETFKTLAEVVTPPSVETKPASVVTQTSATLNGTVNPNGGAISECTFEYGTTTAYGKTAPCTPTPGSGTSTEAVSAAVSGLAANTTYDFRVVAKNAGGAGEGGNETFKTLAEVVTPPSVETKPASAVTQTSATLNGTVNPNGGAISECKFEYGTSTAYGKTAPCSPMPESGTSSGAVSAAITGLAPNTTYDFRLVATNAGGSGEGANETFKTPEEVIVPLPPSVETKPASAVSQTSATLNATVNPNGSAISECTFEYGTSTAYGKTAPCAPTPGSGMSPETVSAAVTGLTPNTTYDFRVVAKNAGGAGEGGNETFKTLAEVVTPPSVETKPASAVTQTSATLNGTVNPNGGAISECKFEYGTSTAYGKTAPCSPMPESGTSSGAVSAAITGLAPNTTYDFKLVASNAGGSGEGANETFKTLEEVIVPLPPSVETKPASAVTQTSATLNGTVNPNGSAISECTFEYGTTTAYGKTAPCTPTPGSGTSAEAVSAAVTGLTPNTTYDFRVVAKNPGGTGEGANETFKTLEEIVLPFPPSVETKPASAVTQTGATLNGAVNPNSDAISECKFEYGTTTAYGKTAPCSPMPGSGTSAEAVSAAVAGLTPNTTYDFKLVAKNAGGTEEGANETFKTLEEVAVAQSPSVETKPASAVTQTSATLNATVNPNGSATSECTFEYGTSTGYGKTAPCSPMPGSGTSAEAVSATVTGLTPNTTYDFRVVAKNAGGTGEGANETFKTGSEEAKEVVGAAAAIEQLLKEVSTAPIPHGIRGELAHLLRAALRDVQRQGGVGSQASADPHRLGPVALRTGGESWEGRHHEQPGEPACRALEQFVILIFTDQTRPTPRIPPELAAAWIESAVGILSSLPCSTGNESERGPADHGWGPGDHQWGQEDHRWGRADHEWGRSERR